MHSRGCNIPDFIAVVAQICPSEGGIVALGDIKTLRLLKSLRFVTSLFCTFYWFATAFVRYLQAGKDSNPRER